MADVFEQLSRGIDPETLARIKAMRDAGAMGRLRPGVAETAAPVLPPDYTAQFNTALDPQGEASFQSWLTQSGRQKDLYDYDMRGWWKNNGTQAENGHFTDEYKKPNHPTFSDQSIYHGAGGNLGGTWGGDDNAPTFTPSETNLKNLPAAALQDYFKTVEPNSLLILPSNPKD